MTRQNLIIGLGLSGRSACAFLRRRGEQVYACDDRPSAPVIDQMSALGVRFVSQFPLDVERVVMSPGIPPDHQFYQTSRERGIPMIGEVELGLRELTDPVIGITGSNGKTTVTRLIEHVLCACGRPAIAVGNVGVPLTSVVDEWRDNAVAVVELSSFQLDTMIAPTLDVGLLLNITADHLDRYQTFEAYAQSKWRIARFLKPSGQLILPKGLESQSPIPQPITFALGERASVWTDWASVRHGPVIEMALELAHQEVLSRQRENMIAAYAACRCLGISASDFFASAAGFKSPPHRLEQVGCWEGITFINDSKATNSASVERAVASMKGPLTLIAGGYNKGTKFSEWVPWLPEKVRQIVAIGETGPQIVAELGAVVPTILCKGLEEAVHVAFDSTAPGGTVLLSPGCSSFDAYRNFEERGAHFKETVFKLIARHSNA